MIRRAFTRTFNSSLKSQHQIPKTLFSSSHHDGQNNGNSYRRSTTAAFMCFGGLVSSAVVYYSTSFHQNQDNDVMITSPVTRKGQTVDGEDTPPIYRIVLTGGPCGGKSSAMARLSERLQSLGFQVFIVTEVATLLMMGGAKFDASTMDRLLAFESSLIKTQMAIEECYINIAKASGKPTILLCDRGVMDPKAYLDPHSFEILLAENEWTVPKLRDNRYDIVIHLVTAAIGAEKYYTLENNAARSESVEQARELDIKLRDAYIGHPSLYIVDNSTNFPQKIQKVLDIVSGKIGIPRSSESRRKFLLEGDIPLMPESVKYEEIDTEQIYLTTDDGIEQKRIQKRGQNGGYTYSIQSNILSSDGKEERIRERPISVKNYMLYEKQRDPLRQTVRKSVKAFVYKEHYFELNTYYMKGKKPISLLSVETVKDQSVQLPDFLKHLITQEVTLDRRFSTYNMALNTGSDILV